MSCPVLSCPIVSGRVAVCCALLLYALVCYGLVWFGGLVLSCTTDEVLVGEGEQDKDLYLLYSAIAKGAREWE